jgi:hypothetical protein
MITRALTPSGDWTYGAGLQNYLTAERAIEQNIVTTVNSWVGDCYWFTSFGVDWYNRLDVGQQKNLVQEIKQTILGCYGVVAVFSIDGKFNGATRLEQVAAQIGTIFSSPVPLLIPVIQGQGT